MSRGKVLLKNTGILMIAKISTQFVSFLLLPLYTALLTTSEYGEIDIYTSLTMIVIPFITLQLEMGLFRFFITEKSKNNRKKIITTAFVLVFIMILVISGLYGTLAVLLKFKYSIYLFTFYLSMTFSTVLLQVCRAYGNNKVYGMASFISSSVAVCLNVFFIALLGWKVDGILLSSTIAQSISVLYMIVKTRVFEYFDVHFYDDETKKQLLRYSVPLVFNQISSWAINYSDRLIIINVWGTSYNGIYSLANKFSNITNTFFNVFNVAWTENVVRSMDDKDRESYISEMFMLIFGLYLALITGIINLLPFFWRYMVNENYDSAYGHVPILLLAMFFSGMAATIGSVYIAYGKTREVSITTIMAGICNITVHLLLLKWLDLYAASISTCVSFACLFLYRYIVVKRFFSLKINFKRIVMPSIEFLVSWIAYCFSNTVFIVVAFIVNMLLIGYMFVSNRYFIFDMIKK